jgi:hypothetical protein
MASVLETRLHQAQAEPMAPIDLISCLVSDELSRRSDRLLERRRKAAGFRNLHTLDNFDFSFNKKMNRSLVFDLATANFIARHEDALFLRQRVALHFGISGNICPISRYCVLVKIPIRNPSAIQNSGTRDCVTIAP